MEIKNGVITKADLSWRDYGVLTGFLTLDYGGSSQGFGDHSLYLPKGFKHHELRSVAGHWIFRCLNIAGVKSWDELVGRTVRVKAEQMKVHAIGHIVKEDWFNPGEDFK